VVTSVLEELAGSVFGGRNSRFLCKVFNHFLYRQCHNCEDHCPNVKFNSVVKISLIQCWVLLD
jgi:hypothetical protein